MKKLALQSPLITLAASLSLSYTAICFAPLVFRPAQEIVTPGPGENENPDGPNSGEQPDAAPDEPEIPDVPENNEDDDPVFEPDPKVSYIRAKTNGLNIRSGPGSGYPSVGYIDNGDMVTFLSREGNWYKTLYKGNTAYISAGTAYTELFEMPQHTNETIERVINEGLQLLGHPYVYGATRLHDGSGKKISGFDKTKYDCSSLMQYIFFYGANVNLNMTTRTQVKQGAYVAKSDIARGDLIFFTNSQRYYNTGIERIGHVALYLGDNYILHTASDYAVIEQISAQRWKYYIETRRLV